MVTTAFIWIISLFFFQWSNSEKIDDLRRDVHDANDYILDLEERIEDLEYKLINVVNGDNMTFLVEGNVRATGDILAGGTAQ